LQSKNNKRTALYEEDVTVCDLCSCQKRRRVLIILFIFDIGDFTESFHVIPIFDLLGL
jgi:hypothetical protein